MADDRVPFTQPIDSSTPTGPFAPLNRISSGGDLYKYDQNYHRMADFLGLTTDERLDYTTARKISYLRDSIDVSDEFEAFAKIKEYIRELGTTFKGPDLVKQLYQYRRLEELRQAEEVAPTIKKQVEAPKEKKVEKVKEVPVEKVVKLKASVTTKPALAGQPLGTRIKTEVNTAVKPLTSQIRSQIQGMVSKRIDRTIQRGIKSAIDTYVPRP